MSGKKLKLVSLAVATIFMVSMFAACGSKGGDATGTTTGKTASQADKSTVPDLYEIRLMAPGDTPNDLDTVMAEVQNRLKDTLNVKLNFTFIPWSDYGNKIQVMMAAGDDFDLHLNAPWLNMNQMIAGKTIQDWGPLMDKYGPDIKKAVIKEMLDANSFDGKIMGIPLGNTLGYTNGLFIRQDLREKYGMKKPTNLAEVEEYLRKVKENEKGVIPLSWSGSMYCLGTNIGYDHNHALTQFGGNLSEVPILARADGVEDIVPIYESPLVLDWIKTARKWYNEGLTDKDLLTMKDEKGAFQSGRIAAEKADPSLITPVQTALSGNVPGGKIEFVQLQFDGDNPKVISEYKMNNFLCINTKCKNTERVVDFVNWIYQDQANYDLLQYGIEGKHWVDTGNHTYNIPEGVDAAKNYNFPGFVLMWNPTFDRTMSTAVEDEKYWKTYLCDPKNFVPSPLIGFNPDTEPVKNEIAKVSAIWPQTIGVILNGVVDISELPKAKKKLEDAGYLKIVEEAKKQVADFLAKKK